MGLGQSDFKLFEDGQEQRIVQFESSSAPFDLMLLIDLSGSTREVVKLIRAAAIRFVEAARPADRIGVITFAGEPMLVSSFTADRDLLRQRIETIDTARGDTKLRRDQLRDARSVEGVEEVAKVRHRLDERRS
jgi:VWFA-related protein